MMIYWQGDVTDHFSKNEYAGTGNGAAIMTKESMQFALMFEEFRIWLKRPINVTSWFRTEDQNKAVGGIKNSNHLRGCAVDWYTNIPITDTKFIKYAKKWKSICRAHGVVGEAGLYKTFAHFGVQNEKQLVETKGKFINWDSRSGKQKNWAFNI